MYCVTIDSINSTSSCNYCVILCHFLVYIAMFPVSMISIAIVLLKRDAGLRVAGQRSFTY